MLNVFFFLFGQNSRGYNKGLMNFSKIYEIGGISKLTLRFADWASLTIVDNLTATRAASSRSSTGTIFKPAFAISALASSTFVPWIKNQNNK